MYRRTRWTILLILLIMPILAACGSVGGDPNCPGAEARGSARLMMQLMSDFFNTTQAANAVTRDELDPFILEMQAIYLEVNALEGPPCAEEAKLKTLAVMETGIRAYSDFRDGATIIDVNPLFEQMEAEMVAWARAVEELDPSIIDEAQALGGSGE